jgi:molybdopterin-containing oxidoreductase family iron-sulfur binding subunit
VFGNAYDKESSVYKVRENNKQRSFYALEQLHVLPNVSYMAKIRNTEENDERWTSHHGGEEHKEENKKPVETH